MILFLNQYGCYLHVKDDMFEVRFTKDGQEQKKHYAAKVLKTVAIATAGAFSTDAVRLALTHNIDIVFLERNGKPLGRVWHSRLGSTTRIRKRQLEASLNQQGLQLVQQWLTEKLERQFTHLERLSRHRNRLQEELLQKRQQIRQLQQKITQLSAPDTATVADTLRGLEGTAGRLYFQAMSSALPEQWQFQGRSSRPAADPFNAFLNYAYGVL